MSCNSQKIRTLRQQIPSFECVPGCHDCCGPVTTSPEEMSRLPRKTRAEQDAAMDELNCVHLGPNGCTVYDERPLICRLFGTTKTLPCPNGRGPVELIHPRVEKQIHEYMASTRASPRWASSRFTAQSVPGYTRSIGDRVGSIRNRQVQALFHLFHHDVALGFAHMRQLEQDVAQQFAVRGHLGNPRLHQIVEIP